MSLRRQVKWKFKSFLPHNNGAFRAALKKVSGLMQFWKQQQKLFMRYKKFTVMFERSRTS